MLVARRSWFLDCCLWINGVVVLQCFIAPFVGGFVDSIAWVRPGEATSGEWTLLYIWMCIGWVPVCLAFQGKWLAAYVGTVVSYFAFLAVACIAWWPHRDGTPAGDVGPAIFVGCLLITAVLRSAQPADVESLA